LHRQAEWHDLDIQRPLDVVEAGDTVGTVGVAGIAALEQKALCLTTGEGFAISGAGQIDVDMRETANDFLTWISQATASNLQEEYPPSEADAEVLVGDSVKYWATPRGTIRAAVDRESGEVVTGLILRDTIVPESGVEVAGAVMKLTQPATARALQRAQWWKVVTTGGSDPGLAR
jgi:hypothetical protein